MLCEKNIYTCSNAGTQIVHMQDAAVKTQTLYVGFTITVKSWMIMIILSEEINNQQ